MKNVRFSKVVEKCGHPEVYLLMTETDSEFQKALHSDRVMSLSVDSHGAGVEYGLVGYDRKRKGQLLLFPKALKSFKEMKVVGIKYDLFAEDEPIKPATKKKRSEKELSKPVSVHADAKPAHRSSKKNKETLSPKVIPFPQPDSDDEAEDERVNDLRRYARQAMRALEKNNSVAAYNLLKHIV